MGEGDETFYTPTPGERRDPRSVAAISRRKVASPAYLLSGCGGSLVHSPFDKVVAGDKALDTQSNLSPKRARSDSERCGRPPDVSLELL